MKISMVKLHQARHLEEEQLAPPDPACPFCASEDRSTVHVLQQDPQVRLLKCACCGAASASRIPTTQALDAYYADYYVSQYYPDGADRVSLDNAQRFGRHLAGMVADHLNRSSVKILDFGGGDGTVALRTAEQLVETGSESVGITVVDPNQTLVGTADHRICLSRQDTLDDLQEPDYDLVIASAVIEHLPQPREVLDSLLNLLRMGGIFYARTPYRVPFIRWFKRLGIEWETMFPAHIHDLGQGFWETFFGSIVSPSAFKLIASRPSIVESSFTDQFLRTVVAYALKAPWYLLGKRYTLVGGWEVLVRRESGSTIGVAPPSSAR